MTQETDELVRAVTELIGNIRRLKNVAAIARPGGPRAKETKKLLDDMARRLRRYRKKVETDLQQHECTEAQRRLAAEHIQLIMLAEAEVNGTAPPVQS